jgi:hypothetical protein
MNDKDTQNEKLESILIRARLSQPSPHLKERITATAKRAWNQAPPELPWLIPFRRLVASAAAAILIIWLANFSSDHTLAQWQSEKFLTTSNQPPDIEALPEMPYGPFVRGLTSLNRRSSMIDASSLNNHIEALRYVLDEAQQSRITRPSAPAGGRSRLILNQPSANLYS